MALMRAAECKANWESHQIILPSSLIRLVSRQENYDRQRPTLQQAWKYAPVFGTDKRSLKELFDYLDLPVERRKYRWERVKKLGSLGQADYQHPASCDPLFCKNPIVRDSLEWQER
ncbi:uncharacterized protein Z518_04565 [Rhinocladiella mackenziei CBS 650.93]|uniref:Uncharacterized protein n=1 Tax=Rhinocladiella mackenziei CBS 650.93 TaxID=1442369 RepID=A0A0D2ILI6_9EURO|nr:uncharacterized protein Z518_04565 [Rhinocladiella mackenziei CBS 650.93]KIX06589.1 hypothetical protein Z518_04565 [Rhinocladiella mackenziei CBS 650.93]